VTELGDPGGRGRTFDRAGDGLLLVDQFQPVAERVVEGDEVAARAGTWPRRVSRAGTR
jgi:hypothetical protein